MFNRLLPRKFYERRTVTVARDLLGKYLVRQIGGKKTVGKIVETEAYVGPDDLASHSRFGKTKRNAAMFGEAGRAYIYLIYGLYHCLNVVTEDVGYGAAVLIRASDKISGPGRLCRALSIGGELNGVDLTKVGPLYIVDAKEGGRIVRSKRVGVAYAGEWKDKLLRFLLVDR